MKAHFEIGDFCLFFPKLSLKLRHNKELKKCTSNSVLPKEIYLLVLHFLKDVWIIPWVFRSQTLKFVSFEHTVILISFNSGSFIFISLAKKMGTGIKPGQQFHITLLISTFRLHGKKGMQPTAFFKRAFIFKTSNLVSKMPWLRYG